MPPEPRIQQLRTRIGERQWRIAFVRACDLPKDTVGLCDHPPGRHPTIKVRRSLSSQALLDVVVHELLHAVRPEMSEEAVTDTATTIARVLHRLGARITPPPPSA